jgi:hypothetical protein
MGKPKEIEQLKHAMVSAGHNPEDQTPPHL